MAGTNPIPKGMHTVTPSLVVRDCAKAIDFYKRALGARGVARMPAPDGKSICHAELRGSATRFIFMNDEMPGMGAPRRRPAEPVP